MIDQLKPLLKLRLTAETECFYRTKTNESRLLIYLPVMQPVLKHDKLNCMVQIEIQNYELCGIELNTENPYLKD